LSKSSISRRQQSHLKDTRACAKAFISSLSGGRRRFSELKKTLGSISQKVLTSTLRGLERDGFVTRTVTPTSPPRTDYELTELGRDVLGRVTALALWALEHRHDVEAARRAFDRRAGA
jgi:DNA-binding HxlR family transcriptional regulator